MPNKKRPTRIQTKTEEKKILHHYSSITCVSFLSIEQVTYLDGLDKGEQEDPDGDTTSE